MLIRVAVVLVLAASPPLSGATCDSDAWAFYGAVRDASGHPVDDAEVFLLLDKVSRADYEKSGVRGRRFRTNGYGKYQAGLICDDNSDAPNPCARKLKHLTVVVSSREYSLKMQVFKLRDLPILAEDGVCLVRVPEIRLKKGFQ